VFVNALASGGYRVVGFEVELTGTAFGKAMKGRIDCLAKRGNGDEAIVDFKYGGRSKYYSLVEEGRAVQLATYAFSRSSETGRFPAVAYLVLSDGLLYTPSESQIHGDGKHSPINAVSIETVWQQFSDSVEAAEDWLSNGDAVPARPLQDSSQWPDGATLVLDENVRPDASQSVCKFCEYTILCGIREIS